MKAKILNFLLILTSLLGYLEWGGNSHMFLFQAEAEIFPKFLTDPLSVIHPFILLPLTGQLLLLMTLFQKKTGKLMTFIGIGCLGILLGFMFIIGLISLNILIIFSTIPYLTVAIFTIRHYKRRTDH